MLALHTNMCVRVCVIWMLCVREIYNIRAKYNKCDIAVLYTKCYIQIFYILI